MGGEKFKENADCIGAGLIVTNYLFAMILIKTNFRFYTAGHVGAWLIVMENLKSLFQVVSHRIIAKATPIR